MRYLNWNSGFLGSLDEDDQQNEICNLQDIGGHVMKIPIVCFQILLFMRLAVRRLYEVLLSVLQLVNHVCN